MGKRRIKKQPLGNVKEAQAAFYHAVKALKNADRQARGWRKAWIVTTGIALIAAEIEVIRCLNLF